MIKIFLLFLMPFTLFAIDINQYTTKLDILSQSYIFIDDKNSLTTEQVLQKTFTLNKKEIITLGFSPEKSLWIKFTLKNTSNKPIEKTLSYNDAVTDEIYFYYDDMVFREDKHNVSKERQSIYPSKTVLFEPFESKDFLIKASSPHSSLIASVWLYTPIDFIKEDYTSKTYIFIFFAIMFILFIYNFFLWLFTKDNAYKYYLAYIASLIFFQANYYGVTYLYFYSPEVAVFFSRGMMGYIVILVLSMLMFTRVFLNTSRFKKIDFVLKLYIYIILPIPFFIYYKFLFDMNILIAFIALALSVIGMAIYIYRQGVKEAKFYLIGWSFVILSFIMISLKTLGVVNIYQYFPYLNELAFIFEALFFAIALAHRIDIMREEKIEADEKIISLQKEEKNKLESLVKEKTKDITALLQQKEILFQELNHRVKNNLQLILSLIKLQISSTSSTQTKEELLVTKNRIDSFTELYENLHLQEQIHIFDTKEHFRSIIQNSLPEHIGDIKIHYDITYNLQESHLLYTGLIVNELSTNAFKYAFKDEGNLYIDLHKNDHIITLTVRDDGIGFKDIYNSSLGLTIVQTLVEKQLYGTIDIQSDNGTKITITWEEDE